MNVLKLWQKFSGFPGGKVLFSRVLGQLIPYTGTMGATVLELEPGHAKIELTDRRKVRNHLNSIHAVAMMNLGELTSGISLVAGLPEDARAIITQLKIVYLKKARGRLVAEARCDVPSGKESRDIEVVADITDEAGVKVAQVTANWKVGPKK